MFNFGAGLTGLLFNLYRLRRHNPRRWLRFSGALISAYVLAVYGLVLLGHIPESEIRVYMRWFVGGAVMMQLAAEAYNG